MTPVDGSAFIRKLVMIRKHRGMTQAGVARRLGITQPAVQKFERGTDCKLGTLIRYGLIVGARVKVGIVLGRTHKR